MIMDDAKGMSRVGRRVERERGGIKSSGHLVKRLTREKKVQLTLL